MQKINVFPTRRRDHTQGSIFTNHYQTASVLLNKRITGMLAIVLSLFFSSQTQAQNFTYPNLNLINSEYGQLSSAGNSNTPPSSGINQYKVTDGASFNTSDPTIIMTMDCLAANGYGQWTVSSNFGGNVAVTDHDWIFSPDQSQANPDENWNPNNSGGWLLLGNLIGRPSESNGRPLTPTNPG